MIDPEILAEVQVKHELKKHGDAGFVQLVRENQRENMIVAEIGCFRGSTTMSYIDIVKKNKGHVYVIDTFEGSEIPEHSTDDQFVTENEMFSSSYDPKTYEKFVHNFRRYSDMITIIRGYSHDCIPYLPDNCDLIYIDADHTYHSCKKDIELCIPKVKKGGILSGHDLETFDYVDTYTELELKTDYIRRPGEQRYGHHPGVSQSVYEKFGKTDVYGYCWWVKIT